MPDIFLPPFVSSSALAENTPAPTHVGEGVRDEAGAQWSGQLIDGVLMWKRTGSLEGVSAAAVDTEQLEVLSGETLAETLREIDAHIKQVNNRIAPTIDKRTAVSGAITLSPYGSGVFDLRLEGNTTITLETPAAPMVIRCYTTQDVTGGRSVTWQSAHGIMLDASGVQTTSGARTAWVLAYEGTDLGWFIQGLTPTSGGEVVLPPDPTPSTAKKWNPGHYMQVTRAPNDVLYTTNRFSWYDQIASETAIEGVSVPFLWSQLEGATRGDYAAGIALVQAEINKLKSLSVPKRFIMYIVDTGMKNHGTSYAYNSFPLYIQNGGFLNETNFVVQHKRWNATSMGYYIDMLQAYATAFDDEPYFEAIVPIRETAPGWGGSAHPADYSNASYIAQINRMLLSASEMFVKTNVLHTASYLVSTGETSAHLAYMRSLGVGFSTADVNTSGAIWGDRAVVGTLGGVDYRGVIPVAAAVESTSFGIWWDISAQEVFNYVNGTLNVSHMRWDRNVAIGTDSQKWATAILPIIRSQPLTHMSCPSEYECSA